jgi:hypothetical protein
LIGLITPYNYLGGKRLLLPRLRMSSPLLAEEGAIRLEHDGGVRLEIKNLSKMLKMKLEIATLVI